MNRELCPIHQRPLRPTVDSFCSDHAARMWERGTPTCAEAAIAAELEQTKAAILDSPGGQIRAVRMTVEEWNAISRHPDVLARAFPEAPGL